MKTRSIVLPAVLILISISSLYSEESSPAEDSGKKFSTAKSPGKSSIILRKVKALKISEPPIVDGKLDDRIWEKAENGGPLVEYLPNEGGKPSQRTEFKILYTEDALYIGVWCFETDPDKIIAREMARDGRIHSDDYIIVVLDTFLDRRNGYYFMINPNGAREDALITNNGRPNDNWNGIWTVRTSIDAEGWKVEIEIPFKSLSFNPDLKTWGFNITRQIKRNMEGERWSGAHPEVHTYHLYEAGLLTGLKGLKQGIGLEFIPYMLAKHEYERETSHEKYTFDGGGDIRYRVTPNFTASLSYNTDFAETEADNRQINLSRFPLFFPEKRSFFLEDAGIFQFGGLGRELIPFFSRRIGLSDSGSIIPIVVAGKLTGRVDDLNIGVIDALIDNHEGFNKKNTFATRISKNIFDQSNIGIIGTAGDPNSNDENLMGGVDYSYRTSKLLGDQIFEWSSFALASHTEHTSSGENLSFGSKIVLPNDLYYARSQFYQIEDNFDAALGFVPRKGIRGYENSIQLQPRPESIASIRQLRFSYFNRFTTDLSNDLDTAYHSITPLSILFETGDEISCSFYRSFDSPDEDFEISDGIIIPKGDYWWNGYKVKFETASKRPYEIEFKFRDGNFYRGTKKNYDLDLNLKLTRYFFWYFGYEYNDVNLPEGDFDTHLAKTRGQVNFSPDLIWYNLLQYDNVSKTAGFNSRIVWEYTPGARFFIALNQNIGINHSIYTVENSRLTLKINYTLRF